MTKYSKKQLNAISRYYSTKAIEDWRSYYYLIDNNEDKKAYISIDKKYKYAECKKRALRKYLEEKYGSEQARKIK